MARMVGARGDSGTDSVVVASDERSGEVLGLLSVHQFAALHDDAPVALITALVVAERARGLGVGRQLVDRAIDTARLWGCTRLIVTTHVRRADAHAFYEHIGFELTGRRYVKTL
jgi:GNAT superfamily N-acetyltransferase